MTEVAEQLSGNLGNHDKSCEATLERDSCSYAFDLCEPVDRGDCHLSLAGFVHLETLFYKVSR